VSRVTVQIGGWCGSDLQADGCESIPSLYQTLWFNGQRLEDGYTPANYGIKEMHNLTMGVNVGRN